MKWFVLVREEEGRFRAFPFPSDSKAIKEFPQLNDPFNQDIFLAKEGLDENLNQNVFVIWSEGDKLFAELVSKEKAKEKGLLILSPVILDEVLA